MTQRNNHRGFTLIELMLGMVIFGIIMISVLESVTNLGIARTRTMNRITLLEELYFFSENLVTSIKDGGLVDHEEYWNRQSVGENTATGHYSIMTGFGNYGAGGAIGGALYGSTYYYCRSGDVSVGGTRVGSGGCLITNNSNSAGGSANTNYSGTLQRYGEYKLQYTDYNGNADGDAGGGSAGVGDEDLNGDIRGDEDDRDIGDGPTVFSGSTKELYLINMNTKERTYFRWTYKPDPNDPTNSCNMTTGSGCLGNIEMLKLSGKDIGLGHSGDILIDKTAFDGTIDSWFCHPDWVCSGPNISGYGRLPTGADSEWIKLFPEYVNLKEVSFTLYPKKDPWRSWAAIDDISGTDPFFVSPFIHPYVRLRLTLGLAWEKRKLIRGDDPFISLSTTISLGGNY